MQHPIDSTVQDAPLTSTPAPVAVTESAADRQPPGGGREQEAPQEADGTEQKVAATQVPAPSPVAASQASQQDRYDYDRTSIILVAHFRPVTQDGQPRQVWL